MKLIKYDGVSDKSVKAILASGGGSSSDNSDGATRGGSSDSLDRTIWGLNDTGDDVDGSMTVNGNISIKCIIPPTYEDDDSDDGEDEEEEEGGGNLEVELKITSNEVEAKDVYATRHLFINYPSHPNHPEDNKKCIGEIIESVEDNVKANADDISNLKKRMDSAESSIEINAANIDLNEIAIKNNADEIEKLKKKTDATESAVNDMMPIGSIIMFNGEADKIPDNWHICDGTEGTPNLIDKFIKAASTSGTTGGNNSFKLTASYIPKLRLSVETGKINSNKESVERLNKKIPTLDVIKERVIDEGGSTHWCLDTGYKEGDNGLLGVNYTTILDDVRDYGFVGTDSASQSSINLQPSYYSLIFIMKIK